MLKIIYGFSGCPEEKYEEIVNGKNFSPANKYNLLLIKGLSKNGAEVKCFSGLPINRSITKKLFINEKDQVDDGATYHYYKTFNLPILRQLGIYLGAKKSLRKAKNDGETFVILDFLNVANALGMVKVAKRKKIPVIMIVTDIPEFQYGKRLQKVVNKLLSKADGYILLTEKMNEKVNLNNKPNIVLEGHCDSNLSPIEDKDRYESKDNKKVVVYAGSILKLYGVQNLVEGFIKADIENSELHIFGDGDYKGELQEIAKSNCKVKYMGVKGNSEVVFDEQRSALLVNPRPISPEYTKYSFPSKNMEYMASGTPILTTKLPGIPKEYNQYIYTTDDDVEGISKALKEILSIPKEERIEKGMSAREFVLNNKSNVVQARKIIEFLKGIN